MNTTDESGKHQEDENSLWLPFECYKDQNDTQNFQYAPTWTQISVTKLISQSFPWYEQQLHRREGKQKSNDKATACMYQEWNHMHYFIDHSSQEYWDKLLYSSKKKKCFNKSTTIWNQSYLTVLSLSRFSSDKHTTHEKLKFTNNHIAFSSKQEKERSMHNILTSENSENEDSGDVDECDPMYSRFGVIRKTFHVSEDGIVFYCPKELDRYKLKMAVMEELLESELKQIKNQHNQLKAKKAEERKLLSGGMDSNIDHDSNEEEATEKHALNSDSSGQGCASKQERKSAIFSSFHDVFSYARTGIQGMFKTSPNTGRKVRTNDDDDDDDSEGSGDESTKISDPRTKNTAPLLDNHDEFTRQMTTEGGLKYESSDKSVQQLSYKNLPPPLSLSSLPDNSSKS